jgi:small subunit ribosomal protein S5
MADNQAEVKVNNPELKVNTESPKKVLEKIQMKKRQRPGQRTEGNNNRRDRDRSRSRRRNDLDDEFDSRIISIRRVTRVYKGGKRMRLSVVAVVGDKKGRVGIGVGKGADVKTAEQKAITYARKHLVMVNRKGNTIPHEVTYKKGAAKVFLRPAAPGTGIIAGLAVRSVVELVGIKDILSKVIGAKSSTNNAYATIEALTTLKNSRL